MKPKMKAFTAALALSLFSSLTAVHAQAAPPITIDNFVRAESDTAMRNIVNQVGLGKFGHLRTPTPLDNQTIIRMNRDTLYSPAILDLSTPATVILPDTGGRYMTLQVVNQDHYMFAVSKPGRHELTKERVGSRYASRQDERGCPRIGVYQQSRAYNRGRVRTTSSAALRKNTGHGELLSV